MTEQSVFKNRERLQYWLLAKIPFLYRMIRIISDPSMLKWEKAEKRKQRNS